MSSRTCLCSKRAPVGEPFLAGTPLLMRGPLQVLARCVRPDSGAQALGKRRRPSGEISGYGQPDAVRGCGMPSRTRIRGTNALSPLEWFDSQQTRSKRSWFLSFCLEPRRDSHQTPQVLEEVMDSATGCSVDLVLQTACGKSIAIEVDGPSHFLRGTQNLTGATAMKRRHLGEALQPPGTYARNTGDIFSIGHAVVALHPFIVRATALIFWARTGTRAHTLLDSSALATCESVRCLSSSHYERPASPGSSRPFSLRKHPEIAGNTLTLDPSPSS